MLDVHLVRQAGAEGDLPVKSCGFALIWQLLLRDGNFLVHPGFGGSGFERAVALVDR